MAFGSAFISIFPGPIRFDEDYSYTVYYVQSRVFNHVIFTANKAFTETRYSLGFTYNKESKKVMLVSPDMSLNETTEDQTHVLDSGMLTQEQAEKLNTLVSEFSEGVFKTKQEMNIFYGIDSKKRDYSLFGNNCTSVLSGIFPNMMHKLGTCRVFANKYLTKRGGKTKTKLKKSKKAKKIKRKITSNHRPDTVP
jgi:hypothetical protein